MNIDNLPKTITSQLDGWDLGLLIRIEQYGKLHEDRVYFELVSEVGWLKGGEEECNQRLEKLQHLGLIERDGLFWKLKQVLIE